MFKIPIINLKQTVFKKRNGQGVGRLEFFDWYGLQGTILRYNLENQVFLSKCLILTKIEGNVPLIFHCTVLMVFVASNPMFSGETSTKTNFLTKMVQSF